MVRTGFQSFVAVAACMSMGVCAQDGASALEKKIEEGRKALAKFDYAGAEHIFIAVRDAQPQVAEIHAQLGFIYFQENKFAKALDSLERSAKLKPGLPNVGVLYAMSLAELGRHQEALATLEAGFKDATDLALKRAAGLHLERANTALHQDSRAVAVALELSRLFPEDPEVLYQTGLLFGNFAYLAMKKLGEVAPTSVWSHLSAGDAFESQGNHSRAIVEYKRVLQAEPGRLAVRLRLGQALLGLNQEGGARAALAEFEEEFRRDPTNADAAYEAGEVIRKEGRFDEARKWFESALAVDPSFEQAHVGLGATLFALGRPAEALPHLQSATQLNPQDDAAFYRLSQVAAKLGRARESQLALAQFRKLRAQRDSMEQLRKGERVSKHRIESDRGAAP